MWSLHRARGRGAARRRVLDGLDRQFAPARMTAITGRSGSGKTTLLRLLAGIDVPDAGGVLLDSVALGSLDVEARAAVRRERIGYLPQEPSPVASLLASARGLLIVDEPTSRLDDAGATMIAELLAAAAAHDRQTVICASHDPHVIHHGDEVLALGP